MSCARPNIVRYRRHNTSRIYLILSFSHSVSHSSRVYHFSPLRIDLIYCLYIHVYIYVLSVHLRVQLCSTAVTTKTNFYPNRCIRNKVSDHSIHTRSTLPRGFTSSQLHQSTTRLCY